MLRVGSRPSLSFACGYYNSQRLVVRYCSTNSSDRSKTSAKRNSDNELPVVNVRALVDPTSSESAARATGMQIDRAFRERGFLYLTGHGIPQESLDAVLRGSRQFFELPQEEKDRISVTKKDHPFQAPVRGYQRIGDNITQNIPDQHEGVDFYRDCPAGDHLGLFEDQNPLAGNNKWPEHPSELKLIMTDHIEHMLCLGDSVLRGISLANDIPPEVLKHFYKDPFWIMRMIHYPKRDRQPSMSHEEGVEEFGCGAHTDYGFLTFVHADETPDCLQVMDTYGKWINAQPVQDAFMVNCGDMLSRFTNGAYQSTPHRVVSSTTRSRFSVPFFFEPDFDAYVKPSEYFRMSNSNYPVADQVPVHFGSHLSHRVLSNFRYSPNLGDNQSRETRPL